MLNAQTPQIGQAKEALFEQTYGRSYKAYAWFRRQRELNERLAAPLFKFEFTKDANGYHPTVSIYGFRPLNLSRKAATPPPPVSAVAAPVAGDRNSLRIATNGVPDPIPAVAAAPAAGAAARVQALLAAHGAALADLNAEANRVNVHPPLRASRAQSADN